MMIMDYQSGGQEQQNRESRRSIALEWLESYGSGGGIGVIVIRIGWQDFRRYTFGETHLSNTLFSYKLLSK